MSTWFKPLCIALSVSAFCAHATDRVLLVGVGQYSDSRANLPGIDLDIANMEQVVRQLGFAPESVRIVRDKDATQTAIEKNFQEHLINGVSENDRVVFYFSGHGTRITDTNNDESDGMDEVLVAHDAKQVMTDNKPTLTGVINDDQMEQWIKNIPSKNVLVLIDSCHSGTATRSITLARSALGNNAQVFSKFYSHAGADKGIRVVKRETAAPAIPDSAHSKYVSLSAAQDTEYAKASEMGSLFTLGIHRAVNEAVSAGRTITPQEMLDQSAAYIVSKIDASQVHHPNIDGDKILFSQPLFSNYIKPSTTANATAVTSTAEPDHVLPTNGVTWERLVKLAERGKPVSVIPSQKQYKNGEEIIFSIDVPVDGYLNIISVDSNDQATILYPNQYHTDNQVKKGLFEFPKNAMEFSLQAQAPLGDTLLAVFVTDKPLNVYTMNPESRDVTGNFAQALAPLAAVSERAIGVVAKNPKGFYASHTKLLVTE